MLLVLYAWYRLFPRFAAKLPQFGWENRRRHVARVGASGYRNEACLNESPLFIASRRIGGKALEGAAWIRDIHGPRLETSRIASGQMPLETCGVAKTMVDQV